MDQPMGNVVYDECGIPNADVPSVVNGILNQYPQARIEVTPDPIDPVGKACIKAWA